MQFFAGVLVGMVLLWILIASGEVSGPGSIYEATECQRNAAAICRGGPTLSAEHAECNSAQILLCVTQGK